MCAVLEEMRQCYKTRNFAALAGLIEEAQSMGNKMEAALGDRYDYQRWHKRAKKAGKELDVYEKDIANAQAKLAKLRIKQAKQEESVIHDDE
jgi:hypothetical protein